MNVDIKSRPSFITPTQKPCGMRSVLDAYFTFKFASLIQHPRIENSGVRPVHCTSLWAVLYGQAYSVQYDNSPDYLVHDGRAGIRSYPGNISSWHYSPHSFLYLEWCLKRLYSEEYFQTGYCVSMTTYYGLNLAAFIGFILFICMYVFLYYQFIQS